jgi:hypothetical protein
MLGFPVHVYILLTAVNICYSFTWLSLRASASHTGMICFAKPVLTEDFYNVLYVRYVHLTKDQAYSRDKPIFLSERMLHKDYDCKGSVEKKNLFS